MQNTLYRNVFGRVFATKIRKRNILQMTMNIYSTNRGGEIKKKKKYNLYRGIAIDNQKVPSLLGEAAGL